MSPRRAAYRAAVNVAVETTMTQLMHALEGIKAEYGLTDDEVAAALRPYHTIPEFWAEWRQRQEPLTEQLPIITPRMITTDTSVGDLNDL